MMSKNFNKKNIFIKLDNDVIKLLCCTICKGNLKLINKEFECKDCGTKYYKQRILQKKYREYVFDFRINRPAYCISEDKVKWSKMQKIYEEIHHKVKSVDNLSRYLDEIDSVKEIYNKEFFIQGKVLDVGGGRGTLRHFLKDDVSLYVSVDPYSGIFQNLDTQPNLLKAYQCLRKPCNFLLSYAENLPFKKNGFDWVHMRSVLDHFQDPYLALKEAFRVLKPHGFLLIGLSVQRRQTTKKEYEVDRSFFGLIKRTAIKIANRKKNEIIDDHMFHWQYKDLLDLLQITGFKVVKKHWQKPPFTNCIYVSAKKN